MSLTKVTCAQFERNFATARAYGFMCREQLETERRVSVVSASGVTNYDLLTKSCDTFCSIGSSISL